MPVRNNADLPPVNERTFCELLTQCEIRELVSRIGNAVVDFFTSIIVKIAEGITWACKTIFCCISSREDLIDPSLLEPLLPVGPAIPPLPPAPPRKSPSSVTGIDNTNETSSSEEAIESETKLLIPVIQERLRQEQVEARYNKISANRNNHYKILSEARILENKGEVRAFSKAERTELNKTLGDFEATQFWKLSQENIKYAIKAVVCLDKTLENEAESTANLEIAQKYSTYGAKYLTHMFEALGSEEKTVIENLIKDVDLSMYEEVAKRVVTHAIQHPNVQLPRYFNQILEKPKNQPLFKCIEDLRKGYNEVLYHAVVFALIQANPAFAASMQIFSDTIDPPQVPVTSRTPLI